jgi:phage shock protein E
MRKWLIVGVVAVIVIVAGAFILGCNSMIGKCFGMGTPKTNTSVNSESADVVKVAAINSHLNPAEFKKMSESGEYKLIDIRTAQEYQAGHLKDSEQNDYYNSTEFSKFLDSLDKTQKYLIYCRSGNRSGKALSLMEVKGFKNVSDLAGGYNAWTSAGYPTEQ